ncbi:hypothetical protein EDD22DRAFT_851518 [Suillus occidentalis]|nr:hypothetical protein EDD22DRAFT_851518 [Suillus occidentalis]
MTPPDIFEDNDFVSECTLAPALVEALLKCAAAPDAASTDLFKTLATTNNLRFWDSKNRCKQWKVHVIEPLFLSSDSQTDIWTVKVQFQLQVLDDSYPKEAVVCSIKAQNTLMYLGSKCEKEREADKREVVQFIQSAGTANECQFTINTKHLFPDTLEATQKPMPKFSLEDFENTDVRFTADIADWTLKDMLDPQGLYQTAIELYPIEDVPVVVPNVRDSAGVLIHPSEYTQKITVPVPVVVDVNLQLWTFGPNERRPYGSHVYQTGLRSMRLLPMTGAAKGLFTKPATGTKATEGKVMHQMIPGWLRLTAVRGGQDVGGEEESWGKLDNRKIRQWVNRKMENWMMRDKKMGTQENQKKNQKTRYWNTEKTGKREIGKMDNGRDGQWENRKTGKWTVGETDNRNGKWEMGNRRDRNAGINWEKFENSIDSKTR